MRGTATHRGMDGRSWYIARRRLRFPGSRIDLSRVRREVADARDGGFGRLAGREGRGRLRQQRAIVAVQPPRLRAARPGHHLEPGLPASLTMEALVRGQALFDVV